MENNMDPLSSLPPASDNSQFTSNSSNVASAPPQSISLYDELKQNHQDLVKSGKTYTGQSDLNQTYNYAQAEPYLTGFGSSGFIGAGSDEFNAENQRYYHQLANGVAKGLGIAATSFVNGTVGLLNGLGSTINSLIQGKPDLSKFYDNDTTQAMDQANKAMERWFPNYYSNKEKNAQALSADNLFTMNFLADKLIKNSGYAVGAIGTGYAYGGLLKALDIGRKAGQLKAAIWSGDVEAMAMSVGDDAVNVGMKAFDLAKTQQVSRQLITDNSINQISMFLSTMGEANMEALEGLNTVRERLISEQQTVLGRSLTAEEMENIDSRAKESANYRWALNVSLLNVTNRLQFPKILGERNFAGQRTVLNREINDIAVQNAAKETMGKTAARAGETYANKTAKENISKWAQIGNVAKKVGTTLISPSETFEEGAQFIFERGTSKFADYQTNVADYLDNHNNPEYRSLLKDMTSYGIPQLFSEKEGIESLILGGLTGGIMESVTGGDRAIERRKQQNTENFIKYLNDNSVTPYMKERLNHGVNDIVTEQKLADAVARNDIHTALNERTNGWLNFALPRLFYGRLDLAKEELMQYHSTRLGFDLAKQELGLSDKATQASLDKSINESIANLEKMDKMLTHVEAIYPAMYGKDGTINPLAKGLVFATYKIDDFETRMAELMGDLTKVGLTDVGMMTDPKLRNNANMSLEELRNKLNKDLKDLLKNKTINGVPVNADEYATKLNDLERLQNLRETYINDYNQIRKQEFLGNVDLTRGLLNDDTKVDDYLAFERHRWSTQRVTNYQTNTDSRLKAMKLSNYLEKAIIGKQDLTNDEMQDMLNMLENDLTYFYPEDKSHINKLLNTIKSTSDAEFRATLNGKISQFNKYDIEQALQGQGGLTLEEVINGFRDDYPDFVDGVDTTEEDYKKLIDAFDKSKERMDLYNRLDQSFNSSNRPTEPTKKDENDIRRDIAKEFEGLGTMVVASYNLDKEGFDDVTSVEDALTKVKNLKRVFDKRDSTFFENNKAFGTKAEYMKVLDDLITELESVLQESKKNLENIQKSDNDYAVLNKAFKSSVVGWATTTDSPDNDEIYKAVSSIVGKTELDDLLAKHKKADDERYAYEIYQKLHNGINTDASLGIMLQNVINSERAKLETIFKAFENKNTDFALLPDGTKIKGIWYNRPYAFYSDFIDSIIESPEVGAIYRKSRNIKDVIEYIKANPTITLYNNSFTIPEIIEHFTNGEKMRSLDALSKINNVSKSFNFTQYWQALNQKVDGLYQQGIVPTMRQIQVVEDMVMDLFTAKNSTNDFEAWTYFNGRIGSGKTRVVAQTLIDVVKSITGQSDSSKTVYLTGDKAIAGINLELALDIKQSVKTDASGQVTGGRSIDTLIQELNADNASLKQVRFILGDEFARAKVEKLEELAKALSSFNSRNKLDLRLIAMGDTLQTNENSATNVHIKTSNKAISLTTELATSYRSPLFSINVVQSLFDNALNDDVLDKNIKVVHFKEQNPDGSAKVNGTWLGVTGVAKGTTFDAAEREMILEVTERSNARVKEPGTNNDVPVTAILIITNPDNVAKVQAQLIANNADMSVIEVRSIDDAQGLSFPDVYVHINPKSKEYVSMLDYNRHMYTALRATRYLNITTLNTENIQDMALFTRHEAILQTMRNTNTKIKDDVANIKTHLETTFKAAPMAPAAAPVTPATTAPTATPVTLPSVTPATTTPAATTPTPSTTATVLPATVTTTSPAPVVNTPYASTYDYKIPNRIDLTDIDAAPIDTAFPSEVKAAQEWKEIAKRINDITEQIRNLVDNEIGNLQNIDDELEFKSKYDALRNLYNDAVTELVNKQNEIEELLDNRGSSSEVKTTELLDEPDQITSTEPEEVKTRTQTLFIPFSTGPDTIEALGLEQNKWFEISDPNGTERYVESNKPSFYPDDSNDSSEEISVSHPTSRNLKASTGVILRANDEVILIPVKDGSKEFYGVYLPITIGDKIYYHEIGALGELEYKDLVERKVLSDIINNRYTPIPVPIKNQEGVNTTVYRINVKQNDKAVASAELRNLKTISYEYNYTSTTPTERDGVDMQSLIDRWVSSAGLSKPEFEARYSVRIETVSGKAVDRHKELFERIYDASTDNITPIVAGRTYIVLEPKDNTKLPQYIELEERPLILDQDTLTDPTNIIMQDWYINPLTKFVDSVNNYDNIVKDVLLSAGLSIDDLNTFIKSINYTIPGTDIKIIEDVNEFKHGNSVYNDLMYAFVNMSYNETTWFKGRGNKFDPEGNAKYKAKALPFYSALFKAVKESGREKELMMAARDVYKNVKGREFVYDYKTEKTKTEIRYYDFTDKKQVSKEEAELNGDLLSNPDRYIPIALLNKTPNVIGGAQMAMNFIAYGNQNVETTNQDGSTTSYSMGVSIEYKENKVVKNKYVSRPLIDRNAGTNFNMVEKLVFDHLFLQVAALNNPFIESLRFDGYQDKLIVERKYAEFIKAQGIQKALNFSEFIAEASSRLKENYSNKTIQDILGDIREWEVFQQAATYAQNNTKKIGHNAESIKNDILNMRSEDGTRHQFGIRNYNGKVRSVSLRMNAPMHFTNSGIMNWQSPKDSTSKWPFGQAEPSERFRMFFTSSFSGFSPTELKIGFPGMNFNYKAQAPKSTTGGIKISDVPTVYFPEIDETPVEDSDTIVQTIEDANPKPVRYYWNAFPDIYLTDEEVKEIFREGTLRIQMPGTYEDIDITIDDITADVAKLLVVQGDNSLNNMPEGERLNNVADMLSYLKNFIPDIQENDLQLLNDIQANLFFGQTSKDGLFGAFKEGIIYAVTGSNNDPVFKQLLKHEAFHKIFRQYLTKEQRARIIEQAREEFNLYGMTPLEIEEFLAVNFQKRPDIKRDSLLQRFLNFLRRIYYLVFRHGDTIESFYSKMESGYFGSFGKQVEESEQFSPQETAYLQSKDVFKDDERLITLARSIVNSSLSKADLQRDLTEIKSNVVKNAPRSEYEKMQYVFNNLQKRLLGENTGLRTRFMQSLGYVYSAYTENGILSVLTNQQLINYTKQGKTIYANAYNGVNEIDPGSLIKLQPSDKDYPKPLTPAEMDEMNVLAKLFNQKGKQGNSKDFSKLLPGDELILEGGSFKVVKLNGNTVTIQSLTDPSFIREVNALEYKAYGSWNFEGTKIFPNFLIFIKTEYPTYYKNLSSITGFKRIASVLEKSKGKNEDELKELFKSLNIGKNEGSFLLDALDESKSTVDMLNLILDKESTVDPNTTLTENIKSWLSQLFINTSTGKQPLNIKVAQAIMYSKIHFYNANSFEEFQNSLDSSFDVESNQFRIYDPGYIQDLLLNSDSKRVRKFFDRLGEKHNIIINADNYAEISKYVRVEFESFIKELTTNGTFTDMASPKQEGNLLDLYSKAYRSRQSQNSIWVTINEIKRIVTGYQALRGGSADQIVLNEIENSVEDFLQSKVKKLATFIKRRKNETEDEFNARKDEYLQNVKTESEELRKRLLDEFKSGSKFVYKGTDLDADLKKEYSGPEFEALLKTKNKSEQAKLKKDYEELNIVAQAKAIQLKYAKKSVDKAYQRIINTESEQYNKLYLRLQDSGTVTYYGKPEQIVLRTKLLELAKNSYKNSVEYYDDVTGEDFEIKFPDHYYFENDDTFYLNGLRIRRDGNTLSNSAFFGRIWEAWEANTNPKDFDKHDIQMLTDMYLKYTSNKIFLDIMTGHNNLTPTNLTAYELTRDLGVVTAALKTKQEDDSAAKLALSVSKVIIDMMTEPYTSKNGKTYPVLKSTIFKEFIAKHLSEKRYIHDKGTAVGFYLDFLKLLKLDNYYQEPKDPNDLKTVNNYLGLMIMAVDKKYGEGGGVSNAEDEEFDVTWFQKENFNYLKTLTRFMNASRETQIVTTVKDISDKQHFFRENKSFADELVFLLDDYKTESRKNRKQLLADIINERYPHLRTQLNGRENYMVLNPFNVANPNPMIDQSKLNSMESEFMNLDGTLINEYPLTMDKEVYKDFLNRMFNGHFIGVVEELKKGTIDNKSKACATTYSIADKKRLKMMRTGIYAMDKHSGKASVKEMLKLMMVQRIMMPSKDEMSHIKVYDPWTDKNGIYHLDGLQEVSVIHKSDFKKVVAMTGTTKSFDETLAEISKKKINIDSMIDTWYDAILARSENVLNDIIALNEMSLQASGKIPSLKYGVPIVSNLDSIYKTLLKDGVLTPKDFEGNEFVRVETNTVEGESDFKVTLENFNATAKDYSVKAEHLRPLMGVFYTHVYINDFFLNQITHGDAAFFPDAVTLVKRLSSPHGTIKSPLVSPVHAPKYLNTLIVEDITLYKFNGITLLPGLESEYSVEDFNELLKSKSVEDQRELRKMYTKSEIMDGGGYMSARARDIFNRGFGENMKMGDSIKPLGHWFTEKGNPINNKYALAVITDEYARKFPKLFMLRNQMDFHGLSPTEFNEAVELETRRINNQLNPNENLVEFRRLQELYDKAKPIHQVVPQSSVKYGKRVKVGKFNYKLGKFEGFGFDSLTQEEYDKLNDDERTEISNMVLALGTREFGLQLNPDDDPDGNVSLPTQLLYFSNVNGFNTVEQGNIQKALIKLQRLAGREYLTAGINGSETTIRSITELVMAQLRGKQNHLNTYTALSTSPSMANLPLYSNTVSSNFDNAFKKNFLTVKFKGTKAVQVSEALTTDNLGEDLKYDAETATAEVYMPLSYRDEILSQAKSKYENWSSETNPAIRKSFEDEVFKSIIDKEDIVKKNPELYEKWKAAKSVKTKDNIAKQAWDQLDNKTNYMNAQNNLFTQYKNENDIVKKMELEKKILDLMPVMMLGFRIPTTGLNSAVRIKIKGFVNESNNRVILPSEVINRMGSDFDIDTLYILRPELLGGTPRKNAIAKALGVEPNTPVGYNFDGTEIKDFEGLIARLRQNPNTSYTITDRSGTIHTVNVVITDTEILNLERSFYRNMFAFNYMNIIIKSDNIPDVNKALNFTRATSLLPLDDGSESLYVLLAKLKSKEFAMAYDEAVKTKDPNKSIYSPKVYDQLKDLMESKIEKDYSLTNLENRAELQILNQTGKNLTGIFASISKTLAYIQDTFTDQNKINVSDSFKFDLNGVTYDGTPKLNNVTNRYEFWSIDGKVNAEGNKIEIRTFDELQWMVNAAVDNAKEQILAKLNVNGTTANTTNGALAMGLPLNDLVVILQQPVIKELIKLGRISDDTIGYLKKKLLSSAGLETEGYTKIVEGFINSYRFTTQPGKGKVDIGKFVDDVIFTSREVRTSINLDIDPILSVTSRYEHPFTYKGTEYKSIYQAHYMEYLKSLGYEKDQTYINDYEKTDNANVPYDITNIYKAYLKSFDKEYINSIAGRQLTFDRRFKSNKEAAEVLEEYTMKSLPKKDPLRKIIENEEFLGSQLYALTTVSKLNNIGDATYKLQSILNLITDNPNGDSALVGFETALAEVFEVTTTIKDSESFIGLDEYKHIELPPKVEDLKIKSDFPIKGVDFTKIPLFVEAYENWYNYVYLPQITRRTMQNRKLAKMIDRLQQYQSISPKYKQDTRLEDEKQVTLMRSTFIKTLLSKTYMAAPNQYGVIETIPMDTIGKTYIRNNVKYDENRALYEELNDMINEASYNGRNQNNLFLQQLSKEPYNIALRSGEIKMKRQNTSDDIEILQLKSAFLNIDQDLRIEFMANNPDYQGYWLSPLQKSLIQYGVIFEGLSFGSSKISLYFPNDVVVQFAEQLDDFVSDLDAKDAFKDLEHFYGLALVSCEASWTYNMPFRRAVGVDDQPIIVNHVNELTAEKLTNEEIDRLKSVNAESKTPKTDVEKEKEEKEKKSIQATSIKYHPQLEIYYHIMIEAPKGADADSQVLYMNNAFNNKATAYIRLAPTQRVNGIDYAFYQMVPKSSSVTPKLPTNVLNTGFNIEAMRSGKNIFVNEEYSIFTEENKPVMYARGGIMPGANIYAYDHAVKGYMQSLQLYTVVAVRPNAKHAEDLFTRLIAKLNTPGITALDKEIYTNQLREYQTQYTLEKVGTPVAIQDLSNEKGSDKLRTTLLNSVPDTNSILIQGIMEYDRINNNGSYDSTVFSEADNILINKHQKNGRLTC